MTRKDEATDRGVTPHLAWFQIAIIMINESQLEKGKEKRRRIEKKERKR